MSGRNDTVLDKTLHFEFEFEDAHGHVNAMKGTIVGCRLRHREQVSLRYVLLASICQCALVGQQGAHAFEVLARRVDGSCFKESHHAPTLLLEMADTAQISLFHTPCTPLGILVLNPDIRQ